MSQTNNFQLDISDDDKTAILAAWATLSEKLAPHLQNLEPDARKDLPKVGEKSFAFMDKVRNYAPANPDLVPSFMDLDAFQADMTGADFLQQNLRLAVPLLTALEDSLTLSLVEAYEAALMFHHNVKVAAKSGVPNAKAIYEDLATRFARGPRRTSKQPEPAA